MVVTLLLAGCTASDDADGSAEPVDADRPSAADDTDTVDDDATQDSDVSPGELQTSLSEREPLASVTVPVTVTGALDEIEVSVVSFENVSDDLMRMVLRWTPDRVPDDIDDASGTSLSEFLGGNRATGMTPYLTDPDDLLEYQPVRSGTPNGTSRFFEGGAPIESVSYYARLDGDPDTVDIRIDAVVLDDIQIEPIRDVPFDPIDVDPADPAGGDVLASMVHPATARDELDEMTVSLVSFEPAGDEQVRMVLRFTPDRHLDPDGRATLSNSLGGGNAARIDPLIIDPHGLREYRPARAGLINGTSRRFEDGRPTTWRSTTPPSRATPRRSTSA